MEPWRNSFVSLRIVCDSQVTNRYDFWISESPFLLESSQNGPLEGKQAVCYRLLRSGLITHTQSVSSYMISYTGCILQKNDHWENQRSLTGCWKKKYLIWLKLDHIFLSSSKKFNQKLNFTVLFRNFLRNAIGFYTHYSILRSHGNQMHEK